MTHDFAPISPSARATLDRVTWDSFAGMSHIRGFNYQPSWGHDAISIWIDGFDADRYRAELQQGKDYFPDFNCVRIWLGFGAFQADPEALTRNFREAIDVCTELGLLVIPTLFTAWVGIPPFDPVGVEDLPNVDFEERFGRYLDEIVTPQRANPSILAWDLCNEPHEGDFGNEVVQAQGRWLRFVGDRVKAIDPAARTCVGTVADVAWGQSVASLCDFYSPHLYGYTLWKVSEQLGRTELPFPVWFDVMVDLYRSTVEFMGSPKPILSTETCWGAASDDLRAEILHATLAVLRRHDIGFLAFALQTSGVSDLHPPTGSSEAIYGAWPNPASCAFLNADGSLRDGHAAFNDY